MRIIEIKDKKLRKASVSKSTMEKEYNDLSNRIMKIINVIRVCDNFLEFQQEYYSSYKPHKLTTGQYGIWINKNFRMVIELIIDDPNKEFNTKDVESINIIKIEDYH